MTRTPPHVERIVVPPETTTHLPRRVTTPTGDQSARVAADGGAVLGDGEVWQNKLIDVSAPGATVQIRADGAGWAIRNIGIVGGLAGDPGNTETGGQPTILCAVPDPDATATIENLYLGDTPEEIDGHRWAGGIRVWDHHAGRLTLDRVNIQDKPANGIHAGAPGPNGGAVVVSNCYLSNNGVANCRVGTPDSRVADSVIRSDGTGPPNVNGARFRGVWQSGASVPVEDCHIAQTGDDYAVVGGTDGGRCTVSGGQVRGATTGAVELVDVGTQPKSFLPSGCPATAEAAASRPTAGGGSA